ncbi:hypothetical protein TSOC_013930, partial [Tetrabaena socialis]
NIDTDQGRSPDTGDAGPATETATDGGSSGNGNGSKSSGSSSTGSSSEEEEDDDEATRRPAKRQKLALYPVELYVAVLAKPDGRTTRRRVVGLHCIAAGWKPTTVAEMRAAVMCSAAVTKEANVQTPGDLQFTRPDLDADTKAPIRLSDSQLVQDVTQQYRAAMTQSDGKVTLYLEQRPLQSMMTTGVAVRTAGETKGAKPAKGAKGTRPLDPDALGVKSSEVRDMLERFVNSSGGPSAAAVGILGAGAGAYAVQNPMPPGSAAIYARVSHTENVLVSSLCHLLALSSPTLSRCTMSSRLLARQLTLEMDKEDVKPVFTLLDRTDWEFVRRELITTIPERFGELGARVKTALDCGAEEDPDFAGPLGEAAPSASNNVSSVAARYIQPAMHTARKVQFSGAGYGLVATLARSADNDWAAVAPVDEKLVGWMPASNLVPSVALTVLLSTPPPFKAPTASEQLAEAHAAAQQGYSHHVPPTAGTGGDRSYGVGGFGAGGAGGNYGTAGGHYTGGLFGAPDGSHRSGAFGAAARPGSGGFGAVPAPGGNRFRAGDGSYSGGGLGSAGGTHAGGFGTAGGRHHGSGFGAAAGPGGGGAGPAARPGGGGFGADDSGAGSGGFGAAHDRGGSCFGAIGGTHAGGFGTAGGRHHGSGFGAAAGPGGGGVGPAARPGGGGFGAVYDGCSGGRLGAANDGSGGGFGAAGGC